MLYEKDGLNNKQAYDQVFSKIVLEHVEDPYTFYKDVREVLPTKGSVVHFFATKYGVPSVLNMILPSRVSDFIVYRLQGRNPEYSRKPMPEPCFFCLPLSEGAGGGPCSRR